MEVATIILTIGLIVYTLMRKVEFLPRFTVMGWALFLLGATLERSFELVAIGLSIKGLAIIVILSIFVAIIYWMVKSRIPQV